MWVVFWTWKGENVHEFDSYVLAENESKAKAFYEELLERDNLYCAGYAPVAQATEPQWLEAE